MSEDATAEERADIQTGREAAGALAIVDKYFDQLKASLAVFWTETSPEDAAKLARLHIAAQTLHSVQKLLHDAVTQGEQTAAAVNVRDLIAQQQLLRR